MSAETKQSAPRRTRDRNGLELVTERPLGMDWIERDARTRKILGRGRCGGGWIDGVRRDRLPMRTVCSDSATVVVVTPRGGRCRRSNPSIFTEFNRRILLRRREMLAAE